MATPLVTWARSIGIVTINDDSNYGNRLQNYALQQALRQLGWAPETIRNAPEPWPRSMLIPRTVDDLRHRPAEFLQHRARRLQEAVGRSRSAAPSYLGRRRDANAQFTAAFIRTTQKRFADAPRSYWADRYERVVTGSDQVWNPQYRRANGMDFLDFASPANRVSYAASFGVDAVPRFLHAPYARWLEQIPHLSVRERSAAEVVHALTGRDVPVVLDPTLLLTRGQWEELIENEPRIESDAYALRFMIGQLTPQQEAALADAAAPSRVADLHDLGSPLHAGVGPVGFVAAIAHASVVITDSFHASVFALLFRRPLIVRTRFRSDSRIGSLLDAHGLALEATAAEGVGALGEVDWGAAESSREQHRADSFAFLRAALNSDDRAGT